MNRAVFDFLLLGLCGLNPSSRCHSEIEIYFQLGYTAARYAELIHHRNARRL